jgi:hypothetical protein
MDTKSKVAKMRLKVKGLPNVARATENEEVREPLLVRAPELARRAEAIERMAQGRSRCRRLSRATAQKRSYPRPAPLISSTGIPRPHRASLIGGVSNSRRQAGG